MGFTMFDPRAYGKDVSAILALGGDGSRLMPLSFGAGAEGEVRRRLQGCAAQDLFPAAFAPAEALAGLWLYFDGFDESHGIVQDLSSSEASYWHAIVHRREPDAGNAAYWFRRVGEHPVFGELRRAVEGLQDSLGKKWLSLGGRWHPTSFLDLAEEARATPGSEKESFAKQVQLLEWQLLFDYCAKVR